MAAEKTQSLDDPPALREALRLLELGLWPIPITAPDDPVPAAGKRPIGEKWGRTRHTPETLRAVFAAHPWANLGLKLGKDGGVVDVEVEDREQGPDTLLALFSGEVPHTMGWESERGEHSIFRWSARLSRYKAILKGDWLPGVEVRIGSAESGGKQYQSVCPPSRSAGGFLRRWNGHERILDLPDSFYAYLDAHLPKSEPPGAKPVLIKPTGPRPPGSWDAGAVMDAIRPHFLELATEWSVRFTGKVFDGDWAECHAIDRVDLKPSAGLNLQSGVYHDFGTTAPGLSFFGLAIALGQYPDFPTAVNMLGLRFGVPSVTAYVGTGNGRAADPGPGDEDEADDEEDLSADATAADLIRVNATISWVWEGWIPRGVLTILASEPGVGKTRLCADLLRRIHLGLPWPDGAEPTCPPGSVALWIPADNQHPELGSLPLAFGFPPEALYLNATRRNPFVGTMLDAPQDLKDFEARITRIRPVFVFIDTSLNATDRTAHRPEDAKAFFKPLQEIAARTQTAILCVTHLNAEGKPLGRRITGQGRVVIQLEKPDPDGQPHRRKLYVSKTHSLTPVALGVTMTGHGNEYDDQPPVAPEVTPETGPRILKVGRLEECCEWLREQLAEGPGRVTDVRSAADQAGFSSKTLYAARDALKVHEFDLQGRKWWELQDDMPPF